MTEPTNEHVDCPSCGKAYRWKSTLVGRLVPCKKCGTEFTVPSKPGVGVAIDAASDSEDSVYALAVDIDALPDEPAAKPRPPATPKAEHQPPPAAVTPTDKPDASEQADAPVKELSEAAKARRREEQRLAAAAAEPAHDWRDYKPLIILVSVLLIAGLIIYLMVANSNALD